MSLEDLSKAGHVSRFRMHPKKDKLHAPHAVMTIIIIMTCNGQCVATHARDRSNVKEHVSILSSLLGVPQFVLIKP